MVGYFLSRYLRAVRLSPQSSANTGKFRERSTARNCPIGSTNNQWTNPPLIKVSLYTDYRNGDNFFHLQAPSLFLHL
ncbi:hypothetical protein FT637_15270 [Bacillus cereus]|nr:hypothetical protein [Bacillus cereus]